MIRTQAGDRLDGVTITRSYACPGAVHYRDDEHFVVDTSTRLFMALGSGIATWWLREKQGGGVAVATPASEDDFSGAFTWLKRLPNGELEQGTTTDCREGRCPALKGFAAFVTPVPEGCHTASERAWARLRTSSGRRMTAVESETLRGSGQWLVCAGPPGYGIWVFSAGVCDMGSATVLVVDERSTIVRQKGGGTAGVRRWKDGRLLIGIDSGEHGEILIVEPGGKLRRLFRNATFQVSSPSGCWCSA